MLTGSLGRGLQVVPFLLEDVLVNRDMLDHSAKDDLGCRPCEDDGFYLACWGGFFSKEVAFLIASSWSDLLNFAGFATKSADSNSVKSNTGAFHNSIFVS